MGRLERQILALLRRRFSRLLSPRPVRAPVLGGRNTVRPDGGRERANGGLMGWWLTALRLEHGLLALDLADLISDPVGTAARVWVQAAVGGYYAGPGSVIPGSDPERLRHFVGLLTRDASLVPSADLPDPVPTLVDGAHASVHGAGTTALAHLAHVDESGVERVAPYPERYTGLARGLMQAWVGAGLTLGQMAARLPADWDLSPGIFALVRDPAAGGEYWALQASAAGLIGVQMVATGVAADVAQWIERGDLSGVGADLAAAYPLASLSATGLPVTLIGADAMAPIYAGQGDVITEDRIQELLYDGIPTGYTTGAYQDSWTWTEERAHSGTLSHRTNTLYPKQYHFARGPAGVGMGPALPQFGAIVFWVWMEEGKDLPAQIGLTIRVLGSTVGRLAYWGTQNFAGTWAQNYHQGDVPDARGEWRQLVISVDELGLVGNTIDYVYFVSAMGTSRGKIWWDQLEISIPDGSWWQEGPAESLQGGWLWSGEVAAGAIVTMRTIFPGALRQAFESLRARIDIEWTAGVPTASVSVGGWHRFRPHWAYHKLWYGAVDGDLALLRCGRIYIGPTDWVDSAPVLVAWHGDDMRTLRYYRPTVSAASEYNMDGMAGCEGGSYESFAGGLMSLRGGYGWDAEPRPYLIGSGTSVRSSWRVAAATFPPLPTSGTPGAASIGDFWNLVVCGDLPPAGHPPGGIEAIDAYIDTLPPGLNYHGGWVFSASTGALTASSETITYLDAGNGEAQILAYQAAAPDFLWELVGQRVGIGATRRVVEYEGEMEYHRSLTYVIQSYASTAQLIIYAAHYLEGAISKTWGQWDAEVVSDETTPLSSELLAKCYKDGTVIANTGSDGSGWGALTGDGTAAGYLGVSGMGSAQGAALYVPGPGGAAAYLGWAGAEPVFAVGHSYVVAWVGCA